MLKLPKNDDDVVGIDLRISFLVIYRIGHLNRTILELTKVVCCFDESCRNVWLFGNFSLDSEEWEDVKSNTLSVVPVDDRSWYNIRDIVGVVISEIIDPLVESNLDAVDEYSRFINFLDVSSVGLDMI